ncbi:MAG: atzE [Lacunisphaera sp.]|nr:atzE [Lacunisphaera sp.]
MDTNAPKTPATLPFAAWRAIAPGAAAREVQARVAALPAPLRGAALAWLKPEPELAAELAPGKPVGASLLAIQEQTIASKLAPTPDVLHPLAGVPYFLKDLFDLGGVPTRAGSTFLAQIRPFPAHDCAIAQRLRELGAGCAGKTHLVEFAAGLTGENPHYGDCPHPRFPDRLSGGSSSGSAALVAAGVVPLAIGTDTGGSVRVPAAWCGLHGFRLTPGDALIRDAFPLAPTMDTAGWFTANAGDMLAAWQAIAGGRANPPDEPRLVGDDSPHPSQKIRGCYLPMDALLTGADPEVVAACDAAAVRICAPAEAVAKDKLLAAWRGAVDAYITIGMSEAHAVHRDWLAPYREHYDPVIWQRFSDAANYPPAQLAAARTKLEEVRGAFRDFFADHDFLVLPAVPGPAPRKADCTPELRRNILALTAPASLAGLPVLSVPVALPSGLTAGLQIILPVANSAVVPWVLR